MHSSCCPVCQISMPISDIEWHVNNHFDDDEFARDMALAQQIALAPPSPPQIIGSTSDQAPESSTSRDHQRSINDESKGIDEQICLIISLQHRASFHRIEGGLITLLKKCLESENSMSMLSGYVDHFQSTRSEDMGWGCGWRNIQMISSHLLKERQEAREVLFGGSGFVPDIGSLQRWLEVAWQRGFDVTGSSYFKGKIYGSKEWIGTTECAAVLRFFGLRAKIVDFNRKNGKTSVGRVYGPMDRFVRRENNSEEGIEQFRDCSTQDDKGFQVLIDWVWNYFAKNESTQSGLQRVVVTNKMPLYFQHQGHSRTIIGIQVKNIKYGVKHYNLLVLDPGHSTEALERSMRQNVGWQKFLKRGAHTLKMPQYQLCFVDPGIARGEEMVQMKTLNSVLLEC